MENFIVPHRDELEKEKVRIEGKKVTTADEAQRKKKDLADVQHQLSEKEAEVARTEREVEELAVQCRRLSPAYNATFAAKLQRITTLEQFDEVKQELIQRAEGVLSTASNIV